MLSSTAPDYGLGVSARKFIRGPHRPFRVPGIFKFGCFLFSYVVLKTCDGEIRLIVGTISNPDIDPHHIFPNLF